MEQVIENVEPMKEVEQSEPVVEENSLPVEQNTTPVEEVKKKEWVNTPKRQEALLKVQAISREKRRLKKIENDESKEQLKTDKFKSKKKIALEKTISESSLTSDDVRKIIEEEKKLRKESKVAKKNAHKQKVKEARELLATIDEEPKKVKKVKVVSQKPIIHQQVQDHAPRTEEELQEHFGTERVDLNNFVAPSDWY